MAWWIRKAINTDCGYSPISDSYVREVQTVSNGFSPEFGRTTGDIYMHRHH